MRNSRLQSNIGLFSGDQQSKVNILLCKFFPLLYLHHKIQSRNVFLLETDVPISANLSLASVSFIPPVAIKYNQIQLIDWPN